MATQCASSSSSSSSSASTSAPAPPQCRSCRYANRQGCRHNVAPYWWGEGAKKALVACGEGAEFFIEGRWRLCEIDRRHKWKRSWRDTGPLTPSTTVDRWTKVEAELCNTYNECVKALRAELNMGENEVTDRKVAEYVSLNEGDRLGYIGVPADQKFLNACRSGQTILFILDTLTAIRDDRLLFRVT